MTENQQIEIIYPEDELLIVYPQEQYEWKLISTNHNVFQLINKENKEDLIFIKELFINDKTITECRQIYKEIYLLINLASYDYFSKKVSFKFNIDKNYIFTFANENKISLSNLIDSQNFNILENKQLIQWIIYQITFGLYTLHSNNVIHHDIKPSNILINGEGGISIIDFGSAIFKGEKSYDFTLSYAAPELLLNYDYKIDEKIDIWGLGVIMLELLLKQNKIFYNEDITGPTDQLNYILPKFGFNSNNPIKYLKNELKNNKNIKFKIEKEILDKIDDKNAVDLILNLLSFDPKERKSAKEILESDYLKDFKGCDDFEIKLINFPKDYELISPDINQENFFNLLEKIK